jgi:D-sedoheptulose 7-phosphate isomerase
MEATLEYFDAQHVAGFVRRYAQRLGELLEALDTQALAAIINELERVRAEGKTVYLIGNGGSAATASHMAEDLAFGTRHRKGDRLRAISLADSVPYLTAAANDLGYESVFVEQLRNVLHSGDVLLAISASGNSPNVVSAVEYANSIDAVTLGLIGFDGGQLKDLCHISLHVVTEKGDYGYVEDIHLILDHLITTFLIEQG